MTNIRRISIGALPFIGCVGILASPVSGAEPFLPEKFFVGPTHGEGCLRVMMSRCRKVMVQGNGYLTTNDELVLDQDVSEGSKPIKHRQWRLHRTAIGTYIGSLTDAEGPTSAVVDGDTLYVHFSMKRGLRAEQRLTLASNGTTVANHMAIRKFGIVVATLDETITKGGDQP